MNRKGFIKSSFFGLLGIPLCIPKAKDDKVIQVLMEYGFTRAEAMKLKKRIIEFGEVARDYFDCRSVDDPGERHKGKWVIDFEGKPLVECSYKVGMNKNGRCLVEATKWRKA